MKGDYVWDENHHSMESDQAKLPIKFILSSVGYHSFRESFRTIAGFVTGVRCITRDNKELYTTTEYNFGYNPVMQME